MDGLKPGVIFKYKEIEWVCLRCNKKECLAISTKSVTKSTFSGNKYKNSTNNWIESDLRKYLNTEFIKKLDKERLVPITQSLKADNGDDEYGKCEDLVSLLSCEQFRKYRKYMPKTKDYYWLITPTSCSYPDFFCVQTSFMNRTIDTLVSLNKIYVHPLIKINLE